MSSDFGLRNSQESHHVIHATQYLNSTAEKQLPPMEDNYKKMSTAKKVGIFFLSCFVGILSFGVGGVALYKHLTGRCTVRRESVFYSEDGFNRLINGKNGADWETLHTNKAKLEAKLEARGDLKPLARILLDELNEMVEALDSLEWDTTNKSCLIDDIYKALEDYYYEGNVKGTIQSEVYANRQKFNSERPISEVFREVIEKGEIQNKIKELQSSEKPNNTKLISILENIVEFAVAFRVVENSEDDNFAGNLPVTGRGVTELEAGDGYFPQNNVTLNPINNIPTQTHVDASKPLLDENSSYDELISETAKHVDTLSYLPLAQSQPFEAMVEWMNNLKNSNSYTLTDTMNEDLGMTAYQIEKNTTIDNLQAVIKFWKTQSNPEKQALALLGEKMIDWVRNYYP